MICAQENSCVDVTCNNGVCNVRTPRAIGEVCNDGNVNTSATGICEYSFAEGVDGEAVCRATEATLVNVPKCHFLDYCDATSCHFIPQEDGEACSDDRHFTVGDTCQSGLCVPAHVDLCHVPANKPVLEARAPLGTTTECRAPLLHHAPGDIVAFQLHLPVDGMVKYLDLHILGTPVQAASSPFAAQGQWEILFEPDSECVSYLRRPYLQCDHRKQIFPLMNMLLAVEMLAK